MLIAGDLAAEQRAIVAHSASYGSDRPHISQAPAGAADNHGSTPHFGDYILDSHPHDLRPLSFLRFAWYCFSRRSISVLGTEITF